ncbi:hypothetical protein GOBAR_DD27244 [Gossypium barbadense]|nr:hypothetical protein GOBAR_DD27244 [Gossypium barbadense]
MFMQSSRQEGSGKAPSIMVEDEDDVGLEYEESPMDLIDGKKSSRIDVNVSNVSKFIDSLGACRDEKLAGLVNRLAENDVDHKLEHLRAGESTSRSTTSTHVEEL